MLGPRNMGEGHKSSQPMQHQHSTRQLISQYESMSNSHDQQAHETPLEPQVSNPFARSPKKDKSPMGQSLRNFLSVLKKVNLRRGKPLERPLSSYRKQQHPVLDNHPGLNAPPVLRSRSRKLTSPLLYLSRAPQLFSDSSDLRLVWSSCTATLEPDTIVIDGLTPSGNSAVHIIELSNCTDVRSLSLQQLNPEESALLPRKGENDEFKVFEILFEGRPREKFAANSVQERAGWVSAIWDTILPSQDKENDQSSDTTGSLQPSKNVSELASTRTPPIHDMGPKSLSQRALPPIPVDNRPLVPLITTSAVRGSSQMSSSPVSPSIYPPTRPVSRASFVRDYRSTSPSIANLSQLSVVRQRLAQIQTISDKSSESGLTSPTSSITTRLTTPRLSFHSELEPITIHAMMRHGSDRSSAADSILDSYGDPLEVPELNFLPPLTILPELETKSISHPSVQPHSVKRQSHRASSSTNSRSEPVIELLRDHSERSCNQMNSLREQVLSLCDDVHALPHAIPSTVNTGEHTNHVLTMVAKLEQEARRNGELLGSIQSKMDRHTELSCASGKGDNNGLAKAIQALRADVKKDLTDIRTALESKDEAKIVTEMKNVAPSAPQSKGDISRLNSNIDGLLTTLSDKQVLSATSVAQLEETLAKINTSIEKDSGRQELQVRQQSETVRYLTELNSWLEALINHDRVQNHNLSAKIDQLCRDLNGGEEGSTLIADVRQLAQNTVARDHRFGALQASLDGLLAMLNENSPETNIARIATLIDHQRQYQEQLVRALGAEISDEIRGERLRFVEAMKEATEINVQIHVEQFKQELKREVVEMNEEVGRLHQDRQAIQNQIADLFAFYRKQKAVVDNDQPRITPAHGQVGIAGSRFPG